MTGCAYCCCVLIYALARRVFGERVGRIAGGMAAICGSLLYFEGELLSTTVEITLNLLLLYQICSALDTQQRSKWILAGILAGLSALTRPNILLFIGVFCSWLGWRQWRNADHIPRSTPIWFIVPVALVILPITWRNWNTEPDLVFISSNGGINFFIGNNANYEHTVSLRFAPPAPASAVLGIEKSPGALGRLWASFPAQMMSQAAIGYRYPGVIRYRRIQNYTQELNSSC